MWCCRLRRVSQLFGQPGQKGILAGSRCCVGVFYQSDKSHHSASSQHTARCKHGQTYQRWSKSYMATVAAGVGISLATYKLLTKPDVLLAAEEDTSEAQKNVESKLDTETQKTEKEEKDTETEKNKNNNEVKKDTEIEKKENDTEIKKDTEIEEKEKEIDWSKVPELPDFVPYILIGGGTASLEAFKAIKTNDPKAKVLMITDEPHSPYYRPILSKEFFFDENKELYKKFSYSNSRGKQTSMYQMEGVYMEPKKLPYRENGGIGLLSSKKVVRIDPSKKTVSLDDGRKIGYDKCLIATGGKPKNLQVFENASKEVKDRTTLFRNYEDSAKLLELAEKVESIAVIGGGFLGSELSIGLAYRGKENGTKIYQVYPEKGVFARVLPDYLSDWTTKKLKKEGINPVPMVEVLSATFEDDKVRLVLTDGNVLLVDNVVVAVGLEPNTDLAKMAGLEVDRTLGGYVVNSELQARSGIWAAGDCACFYDTKLGRRRVEHFDHACLTGRLAGFNMTGESNIFKHQSIFWSTLGMVLNYEAVGLVDSSLQTFATFLPPPKEEQNQLLEGLETESSPPIPEEYTVGVVFYMRDDTVVGIVLWNLNAFAGSPTRMDIAKQIIQNGAQGHNLIEVAKLFHIHSPKAVFKKPSKESKDDANPAEPAKDKEEKSDSDKNMI